MTNDRFESVVHHVVATSLSATWHLGCVSVKRKEGEDLLCMVTMLGIITVGWWPNKVRCDGKVVVGRQKEQPGNNLAMCLVNFRNVPGGRVYEVRNLCG